MNGSSRFAFQNTIQTRIRCTLLCRVFQVLIRGVQFEQLVESIFHVVLKGQIEPTAGPLRFSGANVAETTTLHNSNSVFFNVAQRTAAMTTECASFNQNMARAMPSAQERDDFLHNNTVGGDLEAARDSVASVTRQLYEAQQKNKQPRNAAAAAICSDPTFSNLLSNLKDLEMASDDWEKLKAMLEFNRMASCCYVKHYCEILLTSAVGSDSDSSQRRDTVAPEEAIGYRLSFHLIMRTEDYDRHQLLLAQGGNYVPRPSFDHGLVKMMAANKRLAKQATESEFPNEAGARGPSRKRKAEPTLIDDRFPCQKKVCFYTDVMRNTFPGVHAVETQMTLDAKSAAFKRQFTVSKHNHTIAPVFDLKKKIDEVSETGLLFVKRGLGGVLIEEERTVSCHVKDYFSALMAITRKHPLMQAEQQDPMSYTRGSVTIDETNQVTGEGLDLFCRDPTNIARLFLEDGFMLEETDPLSDLEEPDMAPRDNDRSGVTCHPERRALLEKLKLEEEATMEWNAADLKKEALAVLENADIDQGTETCAALQKLHAQVALFEEKKPWCDEILNPATGEKEANPFYSPGLPIPRWGPAIRDEKTVSYKHFARVLKKQTHLRSKGLQQTINDLNQGMAQTRETDPEVYTRQQEEKREFEAALEEINRPNVTLATLIDKVKFNQIFNTGLVIDGHMMPQRVLQNCFFEIQLDTSYPNRDRKFCDAEFKPSFLSWWEGYVKNRARPSQMREVFATNETLGAKLLDTGHGQLCTEDGQQVVLNEKDYLYTDVLTNDYDLHKEVNMIETSPMVSWGKECAIELDMWLQRFTDEGVDNYQSSYSRMLQNFTDTLYNEVYRRDDMCERSCALRDGCYTLGIFGSIKTGTLKRCTVHLPYDVAMEPSVLAKAQLSYVYTAGYRQGFTQRVSLAATMVVLTTCDPTVGTGAAKRQVVHFMLLGGAGVGKSMILEMLLDQFAKDFVKRKGQETSAVHKVFSKRLSLLGGANLYDEGRADLRAEKGRGANVDVGSNDAEGLKERMSSGEARHTIATCIKLPTGEPVIMTLESIRGCRQADIRCSNDDENDIIGPVLNRCLTTTLTDCAVDVSPDELASAEPAHGSSAWAYQEAIRTQGRLLVNMTGMLINMYGAMSSYAGVFSGKNTDALSFMRKAVTTVLERNGQARFKARRIGQVTEMMQVNRALGVAYELFSEPWGLFSEQTVKRQGGPRGEFWPKDLFRDPQLYWVGKMASCSFQDALAACVLALNQDRIEDVNNVRDAFILYVKKKSYWEMFGPDDPFFRDAAGRTNFDFNTVKVTLDGTMKNDQHALNSLASRLMSVSGMSGHGPLEGYSKKQIIDILLYIMDEGNDQLSVQRHADNLDLLLVDRMDRHAGKEQAFSMERARSGRGMPADMMAGYTAKGLHEYGELLHSLNSCQVFKNDLWAQEEYRIDETKLNLCKEKWKECKYEVGDNSAGRLYFPNAYLAPDQSDDDSMIDVKTIDISRAIERGYVRVSSQWLFNGMRRIKRAELQQEIMKEASSSSTNSGYYATGGVGQTNIKKGGPHLPDVFYIRQNDDRVCSIYNTNHVTARNHTMYGASVAGLPESMQASSRILEPQVPESLQMATEATKQLIDKVPTICPDAHWFMHIDSRSRIIVAEYLLSHAEQVYRQWCIEGKEITACQPHVCFDQSMLQGDCSISKHWMRQQQLAEVLMWMFDTPPETSEHGFRHLCRAYLTAAQRSTLSGQSHTEGTDLYKTTAKNTAFDCYKHYICRKMLSFYKAQGEGRLVYNAMTKPHTDNFVKEMKQLTDQFNRLTPHQANSPTQDLTAQQIMKLRLQGPNRLLDPSKYTPAQNRLRLKLINKERELKQARERMTSLCKQLEKEMGITSSEHKTYLESRQLRGDRSGVHRGDQYIAYLEDLALEMHQLRIQKWGIRVKKEYEV